jgi:hypothetical protein
VTELEDDDEAVLRMAAVIRDALDDPAVRADVVALVAGEADRRERRLGELADELAGYELRWGQREGDSGG